MNRLLLSTIQSYKLIFHLRGFEINKMLANTKLPL